MNMSAELHYFDVSVFQFVCFAVFDMNTVSFYFSQGKVGC